MYSQPHCGGCSEVERFLEERGVAFTVRDVSADDEALEEIASRGYMTTPVTRIGDRWVVGSRRSELERALRSRSG